MLILWLGGSVGGMGTRVGRWRPLLILGTTEFGFHISIGIGDKALGPCQKGFGTQMLE